MIYYESLELYRSSSVYYTKYNFNGPRSKQTSIRRTEWGDIMLDIYTLFTAAVRGRIRETKSFSKLLIHHIWFSVILTVCTKWQVYSFLATALCHYYRLDSCTVTAIKKSYLWSLQKGASPQTMLMMLEFWRHVHRKGWHNNYLSLTHSLAMRMKYS